MAKIIDDANPKLESYVGQLKPHIITHLACGNIATLLDLADSTEKDLLKIRNIGSVAVQEIKAFLAEKQLTLRA